MLQGITQVNYFKHESLFKNFMCLGHTEKIHKLMTCNYHKFHILFKKRDTKTLPNQMEWNKTGHSWHKYVTEINA